MSNIANNTILLISYYFPPFDSVGVKRMEYWNSELQKSGLNTLVFTAIPQKNKNQSVEYIQPVSKSKLLNFIIKDEGLKWIKPLKKNLEKYASDDFSAIIISGGPFLHMLIGKYIKTHFNTKLILDFRDPFYANPRFGTNRFKDSVKRYFQKRFLKYADKVITVNKYCAKLINYNQITLIDNGFDERITDLILQEKIISKGKLSICAVGRIDESMNLKPFLKILKKRESALIFHYAGAHSLPKNNTIVHHGKLSYSDTLKLIKSTNICVIFTTGYEFESTTKIFDFLAFNKNILIITQGKIKSGALYELTKDYPNVFWSVNDTVEIDSVINKILNHSSIPYDSEVYSRKNGLKKLIKLLEV